jgi:hypothetical protein
MRQKSSLLPQQAHRLDGVLDPGETEAVVCATRAGTSKSCPRTPVGHRRAPPDGL